MKIVKHRIFHMSVIVVDRFIVYWDEDMEILGEPKLLFDHLVICFNTVCLSPFLDSVCFFNMFILSMVLNLPLFVAC